MNLEDQRIAQFANQVLMSLKAKGGAIFENQELS
jgi:hypothetical protein